MSVRRAKPSVTVERKAGRKNALPVIAVRKDIVAAREEDDCSVDLQDLCRMP